jgi:predicted nucleic acid-binding protein
MTYIWDTNILLHIVRTPLFLENLNQKFNFSNPQNQVYISAVSVGEIQAIALRNRWGIKRKTELVELLKKIQTIPVTDNITLIEMYAEIDTYSQSQHPSLILPTTARKMGKNDIWIAATTAIFNATLISTDADFEHLNNIFLYFEKIEI